MGDEEGREREGETFIDKEYRLSRRCWEERLLLLSAPRLYGERVPVKLLRTSNSKVRQKIVDTHNYFRTQVKPPAANMLVMVSDLCIYSNSKYLDPLSLQRVSTYPYNRCAFSKLCVWTILFIWILFKEYKERAMNVYYYVRGNFTKVLSDYCTFNTG